MKKRFNFLFAAMFIFFTVPVLFNPYIINQKNPPSSSSVSRKYSSWNIENIYAGEDFFLLWATDNNGRDHLYTWGENDYGQLGDGTTTANYTPTEIFYKDQENWNKNYKITDIDLGAHNVMLSVIDIQNNNYRIVDWGSNSYGALGLGSNNAYFATPQYYSTTFTEINAISISDGNSMFATREVSSSNVIYSAGANSTGQNGTGGSGSNSNSFKSINSLDGGKDNTYKVEGLYTNDTNTGSGNSYIVTKDKQTGYNSLYASGAYGPSGSAFAGQKLNGTSNVTSFKELTPPEGYSSDNLIINGFDSSYIGPDYSISSSSTNYALLSLTNEETNKDELYSWGINSGGNIGNGTYDDSAEGAVTQYSKISFPDSEGSNYQISSIGADTYSSYAILTDQNLNSTAYYWGNDKNGALSTEESGNKIYSSPVKMNLNLNPGDRVNKMGFGYLNGFALIEDDDNVQSLYIWGDNSNDIISSSSEDLIYNPVLIYSSFPKITDTSTKYKKNQITLEFKVEGTNTTVNSLKVIDQTTNETTFYEGDSIDETFSSSSIEYKIVIDNVTNKDQYDFYLSFDNSYFGLSSENYNYLTSYQKDSLLYLWIGIAGGLLLIIMIVLIYLLIRNMKKKKSGKMYGTLDSD